MNQQLFEQKISELKSRRGADSASVEAVDAIAATARTWLESGDLIKIHRINPHQVQEQSGVPVARLVPEFLHGVRAQLFDLHWDVHCPHCNGITQEYGNLSEAGEPGECLMCEVEFDVDFIRRVEVTFSLNKEILDLNLPPVCAVPDSLNAKYLIHGLAPHTVAAGEAELAPGEYQYYCPLTFSKGVLNISSENESAPLDEDGAQLLAFDQLDGKFSATRLAAKPGKIRFRVNNLSESLAGLILKENRLGPEIPLEELGPRLSGLDLTHYPVFRRLFGDQAPSEREKIKIEAVTVLFTDITGSTEMYERLGDTTAYNIVRDHFDILIQEFESNGGVVIKTIGDSLMASFTSNIDALKALLPLRERLEEYNRDKPEGKQVRIRIGMHRGPAILVNLNGRLDYFGTSVNKASRIESVSRSRELSISQEVFEDRRVLSFLKQNGYRELRKRSARLKGIDGDQPVYSLAIA
ncbi:MAG: adenylate/guanylate cyclase domain-containing protein [bacterium]|nr:adenylate/guanylate cyclase domain-containing protein [bacterium]